MQPLQTAILRHTTPQGVHNVHHDWLIEDAHLADPHAPSARLWTARITPPPAHWQRLGRFDLEVLPPHRRAYLTYQGPVSNSRGHVTRVAQGKCFAKLWTPSRIILQLHTTIACEQIELRQRADNHWHAVVQTT